MTITQTVDIPADRRVFFDVPQEIPVGTTARCEIRWFPPKEEADDLDALLEEIRELCKDAPISVDSFLEERRREYELEEERYQQFVSRLKGGN